MMIVTVVYISSGQIHVQPLLTPFAPLYHAVINKPLNRAGHLLPLGRLIYKLSCGLINEQNLFIRIT